MERLTAPLLLSRGSTTFNRIGACRTGLNGTKHFALRFGDRKLGNALQERLPALGAHVEHIMPGVSSSEHADCRKRADAHRGAARVYFWAPDGVSDEVRKKYEKLAELIAKIPPHETEKIDAMVQAYLKSAMKGDKDDNKDRKAAP